MSEKKRLKFLFCSADKFPPFRVDVAVLFAGELVGRGHEIDWVLQSEEACDRSYFTAWSGGRAWVGRTDTGETRLCRLRKHLFNFLHTLRIFPLARDNAYDFIQVKDQFIAAVLGIFAARLNDTRFVYWLSYPFPEASLYVAKEGVARYPILYKIRGWVFKFLLYKIILPSSDAVFVQSEQMKRDVAEKGIEKEKITPIPMGVDPEKFTEILGIEPMLAGINCEERVAYLGTLVRGRKIDFLIRVIALVRKKRPQARLYLVGGGESPEDVEFLNDEIKRLGMEDGVEITGFLPQKEALRYVQEAKVCVSPFYPTPILNSTSPTKVVEYMALGRPVVANDHPEQEMVLRESQGGRCVAYDERAFSEAIIDILQNPDEAGKMGENGRKYVIEKRSYVKIADLVENRYFSLCSGGAPR